MVVKTWSTVVSEFKKIESRETRLFHTMENKFQLRLYFISFGFISKLCCIIIFNLKIFFVAIVVYLQPYCVKQVMGP